MAPRNRSLALWYVVPYGIYTALASLPGGLVPREADYAARIVLAGAAVAWAWRRKAYAPLCGPRSPLVSALSGVLAGLAGFFVWIALAAPLASGPCVAWMSPAWMLRLVAATLVVPVFEEQLMRGFLLRFVVQMGEAKRGGAGDPFGEVWERRSILDVVPGAWSAAAVLVSTVLFALGHRWHEMPAAFGYGLLMCGLWIARKDLVSCVVAHATTNLALALYVRGFGAWELW